MKALTTSSLISSLVLIALTLIFNHGYGVGKDLAERDNRAASASEK